MLTEMRLEECELDCALIGKRVRTSEHFKQGGMMVYALHPDGTESVIENEKQFDRHVENGGLFAVDKEDWMKYLENGEFLRTTEISTEQNYNMIDGRRNNMEPHKKEKPSKEKEALANAVYHKGYNEREPIEVRVLPDRIEIVSHPGADRSITMDGLKNYRVFNRRYRNRRIGEFLKELHLTEGRNTGFGKILRALEKNGSPKPLFETDDERTSFAATIFIHPGFISGGNDFGNNNGNDSGNENQSDNAERILKIMKETPHATIDQIVSVTGISKRTVSRIIKELKGKDIIRREGTKNGTWIVLQ